MGYGDLFLFWAVAEINARVAFIRKLAVIKQTTFEIQ
jgi:hypothetical protein